MTEVITVEGLATRNYLMMIRIPTIEFKQNVELPIITNYFLTAAFVWFSADAQTARIKKTPASRRRFRCMLQPPPGSVGEQRNQDDDWNRNTDQPQKNRAHKFSESE